MADERIKCGCGVTFTFTEKDQEFYKKMGFKKPKRCKSCRQQKKHDRQAQTEDGGKVWGKCESCESETWLVKETGMCGPCTFGEADTINGNW